MFAIIKNGNKQFKVFLGQEIFVEKLSVQEEENYFFEKVLIVENEKNNKTIIGAPFVKGAKVEAKVIKQGRAKKIIVATYKRRKKNRLKRGHRQFYTKLLITNIILENND